MNRVASLMMSAVLPLVACSSSSSTPDSVAAGGASAAGGAAGTSGAQSGASGAGTGGAGGGAPAGARILDVFFGLDNALPATVELLCPGGTGLDGMPVTFSKRVTSAPSPAAFRVTTQSGATLTPKCATLLPGNDPLERFTVLLVGELGADPADPPMKLDIVDSIPLDGGLDAKGLSTTHVTPLAAGPEVLLALRHAPADFASAKGAPCPPSSAQVVLLVWAGGVSDAAGNALGTPALPAFHVTFANGTETSPVALGGVGDHDNYVELCLDDASTAVSVRVDAGVAFDPRGDANPVTTATVEDDAM